MRRSLRQFPRYALEAEVTIHYGLKELGGRTTNLSRGGLSALVEGPVPIGAVVIVDLALVFAEGTCSEPLALPSRVAWCTDLGDGWQIGVAFRVLTRDEREDLEVLLRTLEHGLRYGVPAPALDDVVELFAAD